MSPAVTQPVLVYDRIAQNRRKTALLIAIAIASIIPFVAAISYAAADMMLPIPRVSHTSTTLVQVDDPVIQARIERYRLEYERHQEKEAARRAPIRWRIMLVVAVGLVAGLGVLFWGMFSSPTSKVLTMMRARPAGAAEAEAARLLENLAIGAGLLPPKLYVIDTVEPNAFAAGWDPAHSVVAVTTGLLQLLDRRELEGVLAHEISHIGNRDTRLNTTVAAIALFLRLPYLLRQREIEARKGAAYNSRMSRQFGMYRVLLAPIYLYVFFVAPALASIIRSAVSRNREFLADADAALLTRYPDGLMRALAKIRGAGSAVAASNPVVAHLYFADPAAVGTGIGWFSGRLLATHPPIEQRVLRLMEFNAGVPASVIEAAVQSGREFAANHPAAPAEGLPAAAAKDELSFLTAGMPAGRVFRVAGTTGPVPIYDRDDVNSNVVTRVAAGSLLVVFNDPSNLRQVVTPDQTFGYLPYSVKLQRADMMAEEVFTGSSRMPDPQLPDPESPAPKAAMAVVETAAVPKPSSGLTPVQIAIVLAFSAFVFVIFYYVWAKFT
jgi:heat shock protein HtpX